MKCVKLWIDYMGKAVNDAVLYIINLHNIFTNYNFIKKYIIHFLSMFICFRTLIIN